MKRIWIFILAFIFVAGAVAQQNDWKKGTGKWQDTFTVEKSRLRSMGQNPYFILEPGFKLEFVAGKNTLTITVLDETEIVDGVTTRVVEERETENGRLTEVSRNFFAFDPETGAVYYFGEEVDEYKKGKIISHGGAWRTGVNGAKFGLMMPGKPRIGDRYYQEQAPGIAMDRAEIKAGGEGFKTPAGMFKECLWIKETSAIEPGSSEKVYAPGIGLVKDDAFILVKIGLAKTD